jgi:hypothetical protein
MSTVYEYEVQSSEEAKSLKITLKTNHSYQLEYDLTAGGCDDEGDDDEYFESYIETGTYQINGETIDFTPVNKQEKTLGDKTPMPAHRRETIKDNTLTLSFKNTKYTLTRK